jgi:hypothetical protein
LVLSFGQAKERIGMLHQGKKESRAQAKKVSGTGKKKKEKREVSGQTICHASYN